METLIQIDMKVILEIVLGIIAVGMTFAVLCVLVFQPRW